MQHVPQGSQLVIITDPELLEDDYLKGSSAIAYELHHLVAEAEAGDQHVVFVIPSRPFGDVFTSVMMAAKDMLDYRDAVVKTVTVKWLSTTQPGSVVRPAQGECAISGKSLNGKHLTVTVVAPEYLDLPSAMQVLHSDVLGTCLELEGEHPKVWSVQGLEADLAAWSKCTPGECEVDGIVHIYRDSVSGKVCRDNYAADHGLRF